MTRETKIGLLAGVAFIVVFAVMLNLGKAPTPGDGLPQIVVQRAPEASPSQPTVSRPESTSRTRTTPSSDSQPRSLVERTPESDTVTPDVLGESWPRTDLPSPTALEGAIDRPAGRLGLAGGEHAIITTGDDSGAVVIHPVRRAPAVPDPEPTVRPASPKGSPSPDPGTPSPGGPKPDRPSTDEPPIKAYVVQKGDTISIIAEKCYGTSKGKVVDLLVQANKQTVKNKHSIVEGQKLVIPQLPADQFEPAPGFNVHLSERLTKAELPPTPLPNKSTVSGDPPSAATTDAAGSTNRKAPKPMPAEATTSRPGATERGAKSGFRVYVVQPNDTLSSIARDQLGSTSQWQDIANINKGVDPKKIKPGTEIKVPVRRPVSKANGPGQVSA